MYKLKGATASMSNVETNILRISFTLNLGAKVSVSTIVSKSFAF
jgi:hypothetical protein